MSATEAIKKKKKITYNLTAARAGQYHSTPPTAQPGNQTVTLPSLGPGKPCFDASRPLTVGSLRTRRVNRVPPVPRLALVSDHARIMPGSPFPNARARELPAGEQTRALFPTSRVRKRRELAERGPRGRNDRRTRFLPLTSPTSPPNAHSDVLKTKRKSRNDPPRQELKLECS